MYLDRITPSSQTLGYGTLGLHGELGYEELRVAVRGRSYCHALSAHAHSTLEFDLNGSFARFRCAVALNDDSKDSAADFFVLADGREVASAHDVGAGDPPQSLEAGISGATRLALVIETVRWEHCHSLWIDPELSNDVHKDRTAMAEKCVAITAADAESLAVTLAWVARYVPQAEAVVFSKSDPECERVARQAGVAHVNCDASAEADLLTAASRVEAWRFLCLASGSPPACVPDVVFASLDACDPGAILVLGRGVFAARRSALARRAVSGDAHVTWVRCA